MSGFVVYGMGLSTSTRSFEGITGLAGKELQMFPYHDLALVVSPFAGTYIEATPENCLAYQQAMEEIARRGPLLPFSFGTLAPSRRAAESLLKLNRTVAGRRLTFLEGKVQYSVGTLWADMKAVLEDCLREHPDLRAERDRLRTVPASRSYAARIAIGQRVADAVGHKRRHEADLLRREVGALALELSEFPGREDNFIVGLDALVSRGSDARFEHGVDQLDSRTGGRYLFRVQGPQSPLSFASIRLRVPA